MALKRWEEDGQRFYETPIGPLPSYTTVEKVMAKPWLVGWAVKKTAENMKEVLKNISSGKIKKKDLTATRIEELVKEAKSKHGKQSAKAMDIGSQVHAWIEDFYIGMLSEKDPGHARPTGDFVNPIDAFLGWHQANDVCPVCVEEHIWSAKRYAGTLDLYATVKGQPTLIDFKSSLAHYPETNVMQLGAYAHAFLERNPQYEIERYMIVRLDKLTGLPDPKEYSKAEVELGCKRFFSLLEYWWLSYNDKTKNGTT